jgi:PAS domain S-box-containing protein
MGPVDPLSLLPLEVFDQFRAGVFVTDAEGRVVAVNRTAADMLGYPLEELVGRHVEAFMHPDDVERRRALGPLRAGQTVEGRRRLLHMDGHYRVAEGRGLVLDDGRVVTIVSDVTLEHALHENVEQLRFVVNAVPALLAFIGTDGRYVWASENYRVWLGEGPEWMHGRHLSEVLGDSAWEKIRGYVERALAGEEVRFDRRLVYKNGLVRDIRAAYVPQRDAQGRVLGFGALVHDMTEIRATEEALRQSEHILDHSQSTVHVGSWDASFGADGQLDPDSLRWSDETYRIYGYEPRSIAVSSQVFFESVHPEDREATREVRREGLKRGEPFDKEFRIVRPDGTVRTVHAWTRFERDADGKLLRMLGTCQDITERKALEQALRLSEERYRSLVGAITSVVWTADAEGKFVEPQAAWEAYTGQTWAEHRDWGWMAAVHDDDRPTVERKWAESVRTGSPCRSACRVWHAGTGGYRSCEGRAVPIRGPDGSIREWIGTLVDEDERIRALQELREADRRKDEFLAMLSHELRNPLAPILTAVEILDRAGGDDHEVASKQRAVIGRQVQHMKRLLDDLLDVSRVSQGKIQLRKEPLELGAVLLQAVDVSRPVIVQKRQELSLTLAPGPLQLEADPTRLVQVFANLLNNAAKYTDVGGHIALTVKADSGEAVVKVRDDGMGMTPDLLARAFDLFVQETRSLDRAQGGLGIGLTMVRTLVKMHAGTVRASSEGPGRGSEFVVTLPLERVSEVTEVREALPEQPTPAGPLRVLVVDDNEDAARAIGFLLEMAGHQVTVVFEGAGALAAASEAPPDLVLLDIGLPGMDGYAVAARLRAAGHERAVLVALSGYGQDDHLRRSAEAGFDHHLVKPIDFEVVEKIIAQAQA